MNIRIIYIVRNEGAFRQIVVRKELTMTACLSVTFCRRSDLVIDHKIADFIFTAAW